MQFINVRSCWSFIDVQFGIIPTQLAITVLVCVILVLMAPSLDNLKTLQEVWLFLLANVVYLAYMCIYGTFMHQCNVDTSPRSLTRSSPLPSLQRWPYEISWTEDQRRSMVLARVGEEAQAARQSVSATPERTSALGSMMRQLSMSRVSMTQNTQAMIRAVLHFDGASETAAASPARALFCIETLIKMLYFCKLTYSLDVCDHVFGGRWLFHSCFVSILVLTVSSIFHCCRGLTR